MSVRVRPSYRRKRIWPFMVHYTVIPPRITSFAFHPVSWYTHNFYTGRNTYTLHDVGSISSGAERGHRRRRGHHVISAMIGIGLLAFLALAATAVILGIAAVHAVAPVLHSLTR